MAVDVLAKVKLASGEVGRIGDVGKTVIRTLTPGVTADTMEVNFFYATDVKLAPIAAGIGEIKNIQVESSFDEKNETLNEGDSVVYRTGDLL